MVVALVSLLLKYVRLWQLGRARQPLAVSNQRALGEACNNMLDGVMHGRQVAWESS